MQQDESASVRKLKGQISVYQTFVVHVMKLNLPDEEIDKLIHFHDHATLPPGDIDFVTGVAEGDQDVIRLIRDNRGRY